MIEGAHLKPGLTPAAIATPATARRSSADIIRGRALIFWDLKVLGKKKKLDAIDTDQITPAADCVSESLETLDERWKAGAFRYLMPDFRQRVHRGETFLIAGDRFDVPHHPSHVADAVVVAAGRAVGAEYGVEPFTRLGRRAEVPLPSHPQLELDATHPLSVPVSVGWRS